MTIYIVMCTEYIDVWPASAFYQYEDAEKEKERLDKIFGLVEITSVELE